MKTQRLVLMRILIAFALLMFTYETRAQTGKVADDIVGGLPTSKTASKAAGSSSDAIRISNRSSSNTSVGATTTTQKQGSNYAQNTTGHSSFERVTATQNAPGSNAARREVMRQQGIPTSQQPKSQTRNGAGWEYRYTTPKSGGGTQTKAVQNQTLDFNHKNQPHWEAGKTKVDDKGLVQDNKHGRAKLKNSKSKVDY